MATGFSLQISVKNIAGVLGHLRMIINGLNNRELLQAIGNAHLKWMVQNLRDAGSDKPHQIMAPNTLIKNKNRTSARHFSSRFRAFLQQSYTVKTSHDHVDVGTQNEMASWHHHGTRKYTIRPRNKKLLRFKTVGGVVFAQEVNHPGIPARGLLPTKKTAEALALKVMIGALNKAIKAGGI